MAVLGAVGFLALSFTIVGGIAGGVLGRNNIVLIWLFKGIVLGRYAGQKL